MIDLNLQALQQYEAPAMQRIGEVAEFAEQIEKLGVGGTFAYVPGDPVDWSNGRVS